MSVQLSLLLGSALKLWSLLHTATRGDVHKQEGQEAGWEGQVLGLPSALRKIKRNSGTGTDHSEPFLGFVRKSGTLGIGADVQDVVRHLVLL